MANTPLHDMRHRLYNVPVAECYDCCNRMAGDMPIIEKYKFVGSIRETIEWKQKVGIYLEKTA